MSTNTALGEPARARPLPGMNAAAVSSRLVGKLGRVVSAVESLGGERHAAISRHVQQSGIGTIVR